MDGRPFWLVEVIVRLSEELRFGEERKGLENGMRREMVSENSLVFYVLMRRLWGLWCPCRGFASGHGEVGFWILSGNRMKTGSRLSRILSGVVHVSVMECESARN